MVESVNLLSSYIHKLTKGVIEVFDANKEAEIGISRKKTASQKTFTSRPIHPIFMKFRMIISDSF